jgi:hypothetical protein
MSYKTTFIGIETHCDLTISSNNDHVYVSIDYYNSDHFVTLTHETARELGELLIRLSDGKK